MPLAGILTWCYMAPCEPLHADRQGHAALCAVCMLMMQGPLSELFDQQQLLYDVSGAGNNWAHGHHGYGPQYRDSLCDQLRRAAEDADSLQVRRV